MPPKNRPHRYSAEFQRKAAEQVLLQNRPVAQVARQLNCSPQSVNNWIDKYRDQISLSPFILPNPPSASTQTPSRTTFLPLQVSDPPIFMSHGFEVVTKNGLTLRFPVEIQLDTLADFIRRLEATSC